MSNAHELYEALKGLRDNVENDQSGYWTESTSNFMQQADAAIQAYESKPSLSPVEPTPPADNPTTNLLGDHRCCDCGQPCDCCQPSACNICSKCARKWPANPHAPEPVEPTPEPPATRVHGDPSSDIPVLEAPEPPRQHYYEVPAHHRVVGVFADGSYMIQHGDGQREHVYVRRTAKGYELGAQATPTVEPEPCVWREDEDGLWNTTCGRVWQFFDDGPTENRVNFCHGCGQPVTATAYVEPVKDETDD